MNDADTRGLERLSRADPAQLARLQRERVRRGLGWEGEALPVGLECARDPGVYRLKLLGTSGDGPAAYLDFVYVRAGTLGSRRPGALPAFYLGRYPVLACQFPHTEPYHHGRDPLAPRVHVSLLQAEAWCAETARNLGIPGRLRLPTEFEWERGAGGDDDRLYPWGDEPPTGNHAVFLDGPFTGNKLLPCCDPGGLPLRPRGASPFGAIDMAGNCWEWAWSNPEPQLRGGGFRNSPGKLRCNYYVEAPADYSSRILGFRPLLSASE